MVSAMTNRSRGVAASFSAASRKYSQSGTNSMVSVQSRRKKPPMPLAQKMIFSRRIFLVEVGFVIVMLLLLITVQTVQSANGVERLVHTYALEDSFAMHQWIGTTTISQSPLVKTAFQGQVHPLNRTIYLLQDGSSSFQQCEDLNERQKEIYSDHWQRMVFSKAVEGTAYNFTLLNNITLIAPVVNCGSVFIRTNDSSRAKFYFLTQDVLNPLDVQLLTLAMAIQEYWIPSETQAGSAAVASLTLINDLQADHVDHYFVASLGYPFYNFDFKACERIDTRPSDMLFRLRTIPRNQTHELAQFVHTAYRSGFYLTFETGRFNIRQQVWLLEDSPSNAIALWTWTSMNTSQNIWAWTHLINQFFGVYLIGHLIQMCLIFRQALKDGKWWMPDGSVPLRKPTFFCGMIVALFWYLTSFWDLMEFCLSDAYELTEIDPIFCFNEIILIDILHIVQCVSAYLAYLSKGRVDGGFGVSIGTISFIFRLHTLHLFPSLVESIKELAIEFVQQELRSSSISPMQFRAPQAITQYPTKLMMSVMTPHFLFFPMVLAFIFVRYIYYRYHPKPIVTQVTQSSATENKLALKSAYTNFELATGTQLEMMYGLLSEFDNYMFIKGMKFASADGIYAAGFLIVNKKFLVQVNDIWVILLMKLLRVRYTNVHIFSLSGTEVQKTALLVYPDTTTMNDLLHLSVNTLA